jgi:hypothetical protein
VIIRHRKQGDAAQAVRTICGVISALTSASPAVANRARSGTPTPLSRWLAKEMRETFDKLN